MKGTFTAGRCILRSTWISMASSSPCSWLAAVPSRIVRCIRNFIIFLLLTMPFILNEHRWRSSFIGCSFYCICTISADLGPPRNVRLEVQSEHEVFMSWDPPAHLTMETSKDREYVISWSMDGHEQENIFVSGIQSYTFKNLHSGQLLTAAVRILSKDSKHSGPLSEANQISLLGGWTSSFLFAFLLVLFLFKCKVSFTICTIFN